MAVARDTSIESVRTVTTDPWTWTHTPVGTPKGVLVAAMHGITATRHVQTVTYGGVSMTMVVAASDTAGEPGNASLWFLGSGVPTGAQTISADLDSATGDDIHFISWTFTGAADLEVIDSDSINGDLANPTLTLQSAGKTKISVAAMYGGAGAPAGTLATGNTLDHTHDLGAFMSQSCYETTVDSADHTIGWSTLGIDDLAFVCAAISEVAGGAPQNVAVTGRTSTSSFGAVTVVAGNVNVAVTGRTSASSFGAVTPVAGAVSVAVAGRTSVSTFGTVTPSGTGPQTIAVAGRSSASSFGTIVVSTGPVTVGVTGRTSVSSYGAVGVVVGGVVIQVPGRTSVSQFGGVTVAGQSDVTWKCLSSLALSVLMVGRFGIVPFGGRGNS